MLRQQLFVRLIADKPLLSVMQPHAAGSLPTGS
jgi:hypothetical protein